MIDSRTMRSELKFHLFWLMLVGLCCFASESQQSNEVQDITKVEWWRKTNFYHIYVRSFRDSNGDGEGDIRGIIEKLDYLKSIGVETLLMAPIFASPMKDGGYDIADYRSINPKFGTMQDFDDLVSELKARSMRILLDFVPNHTSYLHKWFNCSERALIDVEECGKYRDYYIWSSSKRFNGQYPTNWKSRFGDNSAWTWSPIRKQFYLHQFLAEQPDLNMRNPMLRDELKQIARFWLMKGIDGFRVDATPFFLEDTITWKDEPKNPDWKPGMDLWESLSHTSTLDVEGTPEIVKDWRDIAQEFGGVTVNEAYTSLDNLAYYHGSSPTNRFSDLNFGFGLFGIERDNMSPERIESCIMPWYNRTRQMGWPNENGAISPWLTWVLGNHDNPRRANVIGPKNLDMFFWLAYLLPGTPVFYYGDEIGMHNANIDDVPQRTLVEGEPGRLVERAIMAWNSSGPSAGFSSTADTWMCVSRNYKSHNVETMSKSSGKNHFKNFVALQSIRRRFIETLVFGDLHILHNSPTETTSVFAMSRTHHKFGSLLMVANLHEHNSETLRLLDEPDKPKLPSTAEIVLTNFEPTDPQYEACNNGVKLFEGMRVALNNLPLCPAQAIVFKY